ncbi:MAG TPA: VOC family protein [Gaiellaceae bacterium]|nr:VOC family protein [Gaiellaceae bacterium]
MRPLCPNLAVFVVPTSKLAESLAFYRDGVGLELLEEWSDMGRGALLAASTGAQVELVEQEDVVDIPEPRVGLGLQVTGVDSVYERLAAMGIRAKAPPRVRPWGMYGFGVLDPNGVPVNVYEPAPAPGGAGDAPGGGLRRVDPERRR